MKNAIIFYFSGTGNTWWVSTRLAEHLNSLGFNAAAVSIEQDQALLNARIADCDLVFLNYPVYGSDRPEIVKEFINRLPKASRPFGIICTQMYFSGDGAWLEHRLIEEKGYKINWTMHLRMPNNISISGFPFKYTNDGNKLNRILEKAENRLRTVAEAVAAEKQINFGRSYFSGLLGLMQRGPYRKMFSSFQNDLGIDPEACTKCGKCIRLCPVGNIKFADPQFGGFPEFQGNCNLCVRCYNFCPTQAILYRAEKFKPKRGNRAKPYAGPVAGFDPAVLRGPKAEDS